jgi:hypothetical protein
VAIVDLGGTAKRATTLRRTEMKEQLLATLANQAYSSPLVHNVVLEIDGQQPFTSPTSNLVPRVNLGQLVYQSGPDTVSKIGQGNSLSHLAVPRQIGFAQITAIAAPEGGTDAAVAVQSGGGCAVYVPAAGQSGGPYRSLQIPDSAGPCTSLSWDVNGNLWAVAGGHIWLLEPRANSQWLAVSSPGNLPRDGKSGPSVLSMQMAPDGVRAALLVKTSDGNEVLLAAVVFKAAGHKVVNDNGRPKVASVKGSVALGAAVPAWPGLSRPTALSWYNPYELVVLTRTAVWQVPLTGGAGRLLGNAPAGAISLATNSAALAVGTSDHGRYGLEVSSNGGNFWKPVMSSTYPTYPSPTYPSYTSCADATCDGVTFDGAAT